MYTPAPGEDPMELNPNTFTAGSLLVLECVVMGSSSNLAYKWSVSQTFTPTCFNNGCDIDISTTSTLIVGRPHLLSYYAGNYTCDVSETERSDTNNNADFSVTVVGELSPCTIFLLPFDVHTGAGIYVLIFDEATSIANNGLIVSTVEELRFDCVSDSERPQEGDITTPANGNIDTSEIDDFLLLTNPFKRPGVLRLRTIMPLNASRQGMYTCIIPDSNGNIISINVGLYPRGFNSGFIIISYFDIII